MKNKLSKITLLVFSALMSLPLAASAADPATPTPGKAKDLLQKVGDASGYVTDNGSNSNLFALIGNVINIVLGILGVVFVILMVYAGYNWLTAMGDQAKVEKAKDTIWRAVIGLIIVVGSYAIWSLVAQVL
jgi:hypothetical protein